MLKWIAQNKYKLMAFIIGLYLLADVLQHKGQTRVLFPKKFPAYYGDDRFPQSKSFSSRSNDNRIWIKGVNTKERFDGLDSDISGFECDVYFDTARHIFDVHHDADKSTGLSLDMLLNRYLERKMTNSIWLDFKNLGDANSKTALLSLIDIRNKYGLQNKLLVESGRADLLTAFSDSGFFTSYYAPMFNPYQINDAEIKFWVDSIASVIKNARINALSGYYFQYRFFQHYFPNYPVLTWADNDRFSLVNWYFKRKLYRDRTVLIALYP
jgi:hypothetical protein